MLTKEDIIEQIKKDIIIGVYSYKKDEDDMTFDEKKEIIRKANHQYVQRNITNTDLTTGYQDGTVGALKMGDVSDFLLEQKQFNILDVAGFVNICCGIKLKDATKQDQESAKKYLIEGIANGVNIEGVKKRAFAIRDMLYQYQQSDNVRYADELEQISYVISFCNENETISPYYEIKELAKKISSCKLVKQAAEISGNTEKINSCNKIIQDIENEIQDFIENCYDKGLDPELAEEYFEALKANSVREKLGSRIIINQKLDIKKEEEKEKSL